MNQYRKLFSDTGVLAVGTFASKLLVFLLMPLYTALLSPAEYGTAELISSTANLIMPFACMGITLGIFRFVAEKNSNREAVFSSGAALLGCGMLVLLAAGIPAVLFGKMKTETLLIVFYVLFADLQAVCAQYVRGIDRTKLFAFQGILNTLVTILANIVFLVVFHMGVTGYVLAVIVGNAVTTLFLIIAAKLWKVFRLSQIKKSVMKDLLWFSLPLVPTTVCWLITDLSDRYFVQYFCGAAETGIYSAAYKIPTMVNLAAGIFLQAWQFSAVSQSSDKEACRTFYSQVFKGFLSVIFLGTAGLLLLSGWLTDLLLDEAYLQAARYMPTLLAAVAFEAVVSFLASVYLVEKKSMHSFVTAMVGTLLNLLLNAWMIPKAGALGAAVATLIGYFSVYLLRMIDAPRMIRFRLFLPRQAASFALILILTYTMTVKWEGYLWTAIPLTAGLAAINLPSLLAGLKGLLKERKNI